MLDFWTLHSLLGGLISIGGDCKEDGLNTIVIDVGIHRHNAHSELLAEKSSNVIHGLDRLKISADPDEELELVHVIASLLSYFDTHQSLFESSRIHFLEGVEETGKGKYRFHWGS